MRVMLNAGLPARLDALSFLTTNLSDFIFGDVLGALQNGSLPTSRDALQSRTHFIRRPGFLCAALPRLT